MQLPYDIAKLLMEASLMKLGDMVLVTEYGGGKATRRVVADRGKTVVVCNEKEYASATAEHREPDGIGFPREAVVDIENNKA